MMVESGGFKIPTVTVWVWLSVPVLNATFSGLCERMRPSFSFPVQYCLKYLSVPLCTSK